MWNGTNMINWIISNIESVKSLDGLNNVVKNVHYIVEVKNRKGDYARCWGNQQLDIHNLNESTFTNFNNLTRDDVIGMLQASLGEEKIEDMYKYLHDELKNKRQVELKIGLPSSW